MTTQYQYVPAKTSHLLHLALTCLTFGFWAPVWITMTVYNHNRTVMRALPTPVQPVYQPYGYPPLPGPPVPQVPGNRVDWPRPTGQTS